MPAISPSYWPIAQLPGLKAIEISGLQQAGIETTQDLLRLGPSRDLRQKLAAELKHKVERVNRWMAMADLARVPTVGCIYCGLLLHSGIISVRQLAECAAHRLHQQVRRMHVATLRNARDCPSIADVSQWIAQAKQLV
ncbi:MAG: DUF4332 domain-containing protein [Synechococcus sp.]